MLKKKFHWFIRDKHGHIVIWQAPNVPIAGWFIFMVLSHLLGAGRLQSATAGLGTAFLFMWAYLEITEGASPFRRVLGAVVMIVVVVGLFR